MLKILRYFRSTFGLKKFVSRYGLYFGFVLKRVVDLKICFLNGAVENITNIK